MSSNLPDALLHSYFSNPAFISKISSLVSANTQTTRPPLSVLSPRLTHSSLSVQAISHSSPLAGLYPRRKSRVSRVRQTRVSLSHTRTAGCSATGAPLIDDAKLACEHSEPTVPRASRAYSMAFQSSGSSFTFRQWGRQRRTPWEYQLTSVCRERATAVYFRQGRSSRSSPVAMDLYCPRIAGARTSPIWSYITPHTGIYGWNSTVV